MFYKNNKNHTWKYFGFVCFGFTILMFHITIPNVNWYYDPHLNTTISTHNNSIVNIQPSPWWDGGNCDDIQNDTEYQISHEIGGTCGRRSWKLGGGQKVISYSLYGNNIDYWNGLNKLLSSIGELYQGWLVRLYTVPGDKREIICPLLKRFEYLHICDVSNLPSPYGDITSVFPMLWRTMPMVDPLVEVFLSRDTDSMVTQREVKAVEEWLRSNTALHVMRDHPDHVAPIMGGMYGIKIHQSNRILFHSIIKDILRIGRRKQEKGFDQTVLQNVMWFKLVKNMVSHDSYSCWMFPRTRPFPTKRIGHDFVGSPRYRKEYVNISLTTVCPMKCRPKEHKNWLYC